MPAWLARVAALRVGLRLHHSAHRGLFDLSADDAATAAIDFFSRFSGDVRGHFIRPQHDRSWLRESGKSASRCAFKRKLSIIVPLQRISHIDIAALCRAVKITWRRDARIVIVDDAQ